MNDILSTDELMRFTGETKSENKECLKHGKYTAMLTKFGERWVGGKCPQCTELEIKSRKIPESVKPLVIPPRFRHCTFDNYIPSKIKSHQLAYATCKKYAENFEERLEAGGSLILHGKCGTGKTHLATAIARHVTDIGKSVMMTKVYDMTGAVKNTWGDQSQKESDVIKLFVTPDLLIIDEIGLQFDTEAERQILFRILNHRYEHMKPVVILSNLDATELLESLTERVIDRLNEGGGSRLVFDWESHRK